MRFLGPIRKRRANPLEGEVGKGCSAVGEGLLGLALGALPHLMGIVVGLERGPT